MTEGRFYKIKQEISNKRFEHKTREHTQKTRSSSKLQNHKTFKVTTRRVLFTQQHFVYLLNILFAMLFKAAG